MIFADRVSVKNWQENFMNMHKNTGSCAIIYSFKVLHTWLLILGEPSPCTLLLYHMQSRT